MREGGSSGSSNASVSGWVHDMETHEATIQSGDTISVTPDGHLVDDLREVIDDLTVENLHLKESLRRMRCNHEHPQGAEALFEIRYHSLHPSKKIELEHLLSDFVRDLDTEPSTTDKHRDNPLPAAQGLDSVHGLRKDSAYASVSSSGRWATGRDTGQTDPSTSSKSTPRKGKGKHHHVPRLRQDTKTLAPLIIQRLENLFKGQSTHGKLFGEAEIRPRQSQFAQLQSSHVVECHGVAREAQVSSCSVASSSKPREQRATTLAELDPNREQNAMDNMDYIRRLGPPETKIDPTMQDTSRGWIYLNLLSSMAQLHLINVTPKSIKSAVANSTDKFQLSDDGRRVRWIGNLNHSPLQSPSTPLSPERSFPGPATLPITAMQVDYVRPHRKEDQTDETNIRSALNHTSRPVVYYPGLPFWLDSSAQDTSRKSTDINKDNTSTMERTPMHVGPRSLGFSDRYFTTDSLAKPDPHHWQVPQTPEHEPEAATKSIDDVASVNGVYEESSIPITTKESLCAKASGIADVELTDHLLTRVSTKHHNTQDNTALPIMPFCNVPRHALAHLFTSRPDVVHGPRIGRVAIEVEQLAASRLPLASVYYESMSSSLGDSDGSDESMDRAC